MPARRWFIAAVLVACASGASGARAAPALRVSLSAGAAFIAGPESIDERWNFGPSVAAIVGFEVTRRVRIGGEIVYQRLRFDEDAFAAAIATLYPNVSIGGNDVDVASFGARLEVALRAWGTTKPFALAGAGYDRVTRTASRASGPNAALIRFPQFDEDGFAFQLGGGVRTVLTPRATLFAEAAYHFGTASDAARWVPLRLGVSF
jgi:opacity protein-like surface antigen